MSILSDGVIGNAHIKADRISNLGVSKLNAEQIDWRGSLPGKFAPVCPPRIYKSFLNHGYIPSTVLLLAHDVVEHEKEYKELFEDNRWANTNIIMDNSLIELGEAVTLDMIKQAVKIVNADVVVLPDTLNNGTTTASQIQNAWEEWRWAFMNKNLMTLVQGKDLRDWMYCLEAIDEHASPDWIGIPRCMEGIEGKTRSDFIAYAQLVFPNRPIHLFGCSDYPWEDFRAAKNRHVRSIDSAAPLRNATDFVLSENPGPRGDWWNTCIFNTQMLDNISAINRMIG